MTPTLAVTLISLQALVFTGFLVWLCKREGRPVWWALAGITAITFAIAVPLICRPREM